MNYVRTGVGERDGTVKLTIDSHTQIKTWASAHRTTIEAAVEQAIKVLMAVTPLDSTGQRA